MIYFIALSPSAALQQELLSRGLSWKAASRLPIASTGCFVICHCDSQEASQQLHEWSQNNGPSLFARVFSTPTPPKGKSLSWGLSSWEQSFRESLPLYEAWSLLHLKWQESETKLADLVVKTDKLVEQFQRDLELASSIQKTLLPTSDFTLPGVSVTTKYLPAAGLGGDYFDVFELSDKRHLGILVADSETHGMAAALLSVLLKLQVDEFKSLASSSKALVEHLNQALYQIHLSKLPGLNFFFGILDRVTLSFDFTSAGSLNPLLFSHSGLTPIHHKANPPLGLKPDTLFLENTCQLKPGDLIFLHTDGLKAILEREKGTLMTELERLFSSFKPVDPIRFQTELLAKINQLKEEQTELPDDVTLIQLLIDQRVLYLAQSK